MDRLLIASIVEARGAERFGLIAEALPNGQLKSFYCLIADSEKKHYRLFLQLAEQHCDNNAISKRLDFLLNLEADIIRQLPERPALH